MYCLSAGLHTMLIPNDLQCSFHEGGACKSLLFSLLVLCVCLALFISEGKPCARCILLQSR